MTIPAVTRIPARAYFAGESESRKLPAGESPASPTPDVPPEDGNDILEAATQGEDATQTNPFNIDRKTVNGVLGKARVLIAEILGLEKPEEASWFDIVVHVAKLVLDAATNGAKTPRPGAT